MFRFLPATSGRGWLALTLSLALHAALGVLVALPSIRAGRGTATATAPVLVLEIVEEGEQSEQPGVASSATDHGSKAPSVPPAPRQIVVGPSFENIVPVAHTTGIGAELPMPLGAGDAQRGNPSGGEQGGGPSFFQIGTQATRIVYVMDRSASMGAGLLDVAVRELLASVDRLPATVQFQVVVYHDRAELLVPGRSELIAASTQNKALVGEALMSLRAEGGTCHREGVRVALTLDPQVIYLLTDADDLTHEERREITRLNRGRAILHTIELNTANRGRTEMPLQMLARENGGRYQAVEPR
ncbi:MAG TPA: VWA domain-containing protein [Gemmataceae bacterium]|nr:VWA domain-containing protein [Gemmataceae bacterium]